MQEADVDFHIHSRHSGGCSSDMTLPRIAEGAESKGLDIMGTGDATNPEWLKHISESLVEGGDGIYSLPGSKTRFIITGEIEDKHRVHHLLIFPGIDNAEAFRNNIKKSSVDIDREGRPHVAMSGEELVDLANDCDALIGPCHAFTPWTSVYKAFNSLRESYGDNLRYVKFLELGLSADTQMADTVPELKELTFMTNSDAHSPWPHRLGREFNRISVSEISFDEIKKAIERKAGRGFVLNVGLDPREGKYHETACTRCFLKFRPEDAVRLKRRCPECKGIIKKGVVERIWELSEGAESDGPKHRPPYIHTVPLAEVISLSLGVKTLTSPRVQEAWHCMVKKFGNEIKILIDKDISCIKKQDEIAGDIIASFRQGRMEYDSGGGGKYGRPLYNKVSKERFYDDSQKCLGAFGDGCRQA
jgi:uncharacterized protein (TIGR00375 family)